MRWFGEHYGGPSHAIRWRPHFAWWPTSAGWLRWVERRDRYDGKQWGFEYRPLNLDDYP